MHFSRPAVLCWLQRMKANPALLPAANLCRASTARQSCRATESRQERPPSRGNITDYGQLPSLHLEQIPATR